MLPAQRNKVDISKLTPAEQQAFRLYGKLPSRPVSKSQERKYFDSGDFALAKAGKAGHNDVGKAIPRADEIPHASPTPMSLSSSAGSASSASPPSGIPISGSMGGASGIISPTGLASSGAGSPGSGHAIPINGAGFNNGNAAESGINLSMSPGRVGVGQPLASSPTRSFASPFARSSTSPTHAVYSPSSPSSATSNPLVSRLDREHGSSPAASVTSPSTMAHTPVQVAGTTGNQIGRIQIRRTSQSEGSGLNPTSPPTSSLAHSIMPTEGEDDEVDGMELQ